MSFLSNRVPFYRATDSDTQPQSPAKTTLFSLVLPPLFVAVFVVAVWAVIASLHLYPASAFPAPLEVVQAFGEDVRDGSLLRNIIASLFRVAVGFALAAGIGIPLGLWMGSRPLVRIALLPLVNFMRNLSPIVWIPFAVLWFGVGDTSAIFLITIAAIFPLTLATAAAVASVPSVYFRVARDYNLTGSKLWTTVTLPAILPQVITALRVTMGLSWLVTVAAEMIAGRDGLGYLVWDARNGLRVDRMMEAMIVIGIIGVILDRLLMRLSLLPNVRWGYER